MHFDVFTALTASTAVLLLLSMVLAVFWRRSRKSPWLGYWSLSYLCIGCGNFLVIIAADVPRPAMFAVGCSVFLLGFALIWQAVRVFEGRRPRWATMAVVVFGWPLLFLLPEIYGVPSLRVALVSVAIAGGLALAALETWRGRDEGLPSKRMLAALLLGMAFVAAARVFLGGLAAYPIGAQPANDGVVIVLIGGLIVFSIVQATLVLSMGLERSEKSQRQLAATDSLTGLLNRRGLEAAFPDDRLPAGSALVVFDLDRFKQVNDSFGHAAGDELIAAFAMICREELRQIDHAIRLGGEEFVLVLLRASEKAAMDLAERVRRRFSETVVRIEGGAVVGTASGGIFCAPPDEPAGLTRAIAVADRAMYRAKSAGRNRVFVHNDEDEASRSFDERCVEPDRLVASA